MVVQVLDQCDRLISGAQIESSNGRKTTTNEERIAKVRFGSVGVHSVTVVADNHMPNNFIVTMPTDNGMSKTLRLSDTVEFTSITFGSANLYPLLFNYMFSSYGYGLELNDYQEGQWTKWEISTEEQGDP